MTYDLQAAMMDMAKPCPGWLGNYTTTEAPGGLKNGTRILKAAEEPRDATPLGTHGTVLGSLLHPTHGIFYFIEWDDKPKCAVAVIAWKVGML